MRLQLVLATVAVAVLLASGAEADGTSRLRQVPHARGRVALDDVAVDLGEDGKLVDSVLEPIGERNLAGLQRKWNFWFAARQGEQKYIHTFRGETMKTSVWKNPYVPVSGVAKYWNVPYAKARIEKALAEDDIEINKKSYIKEDVFFSELRKAAQTLTRWEKARGGPWMFLVGGYVRDLLIPEPVSSKDVDIGVMENPEVFEDICDTLGWTCHTERHSFFNIFKFGLALPGYGDHVTAIEALPSLITVGATNAWRDYTVNAVYYDTQTGVFLDPTGTGKSDCSAMRLRIANQSEGIKDKRSWYKFFDETWYETGAGPQKIARWFHMRIKGFKAEAHSRSYVMNKMKRMSSSEIGLVVRQWSRQTLGNQDTQGAKAVKLFNIMVEDADAVWNSDAKTALFVEEWYNAIRSAWPRSMYFMPRLPNILPA